LEWKYKIISNAPGQHRISFDQSTLKRGKSSLVKLSLEVSAVGE